MQASLWHPSRALHMLLLAGLMAMAATQDSSGWQSGTLGKLGYGAVSRAMWKATRHPGEGAGSSKS